MSIICKIEKSKHSGKKYQVSIFNLREESVRTIHFGAKGYSDYTIHKDVERMNRYDLRHKRREDWTKGGLYTAGFWAKWILWNKPSFQASVRDTAKRFGIKIMVK